MKNFLWILKDDHNMQPLWKFGASWTIFHKVTAHYDNFLIFYIRRLFSEREIIFLRWNRILFEKPFIDLEFMMLFCVFIDTYFLCYEILWSPRFLFSTSVELQSDNVCVCFIKTLGKPREVIIRSIMLKFDSLVDWMIKIFLFCPLGPLGTHFPQKLWCSLEKSKMV